MLAKARVDLTGRVYKYLSMNMRRVKLPLDRERLENLSKLKEKDIEHLNDVLQETPSTTNDEFFTDPQNHMAAKK